MDNFFLLHVFSPTCLYWTAVIACTGRSKKQPLSLSHSCKDVIPHPRLPPLLVASSNSPLSQITEVVLHSIKFVRDSHDLEAFLHNLEGNPTPHFKIPVARIHKECPLQPSSRCCLVGGSAASEAAAKSWRLCSCYVEVPKTLHSSCFWHLLPPKKKTLEFSHYKKGNTVKLLKN